VPPTSTRRSKVSKDQHKKRKKRTTWSCLPEGLRQTGIINGRSEFVKGVGGSEASAQIEANGAATRSIETPLACYLYATAYTFLQNRSGDRQPRHQIQWSFAFSRASQWCWDRGTCSICVKLEKPRAQGNPLTRVKLCFKTCNLQILARRL
jgi:hypothetical protein